MPAFTNSPSLGIIYHTRRLFVGENDCNSKCTSKECICALARDGKTIYNEENGKIDVSAFLYKKMDTEMTSSFLGCWCKRGIT